jgi:SAM-dependent methyltransferase
VTPDPEAVEALLAEQAAYYRAVAAEYGDHAIDSEGESELLTALETFRPVGSVLELACGPGNWTVELLRNANSATAIDASPEMLEVARRRVEDERVHFVQADLFNWRPEERYDVVFFAFWLSHVPLERFASFWSLVRDCLTPGGRVFFIDDAYRTPEELIEGEASSTIRRRLNDGTAYRAVKVPHTVADLEERLARLGWDFEVTQTSGRFYWGGGGLSRNVSPETTVSGTDMRRPQSLPY